MWPFYPCISGDECGVVAVGGAMWAGIVDVFRCGWQVSMQPQAFPEGDNLLGGLDAFPPPSATTPSTLAPAQPHQPHQPSAPRPPPPQHHTGMPPTAAPNSAQGPPPPLHPQQPPAPPMSSAASAPQAPPASLPSFSCISNLSWVRGVVCCVARDVIALFVPPPPHLCRRLLMVRVGWCVVCGVCCACGSGHRRSL